ncbi:MAG: T9SS type A sorting domain-containing protein [Bacteroidota bacterium]
MKRLFLLLLFSCFTATIWCQNGGGTECSANAGPDQKVCQCDLFKLSAPPSADYRVPLNCKWEYVSGLVAANLISFSKPNSLETVVNYLGSGCLPVGNYVFRFCVDCRDINSDGRSDRPCDEVTVTVTPPVTQPLIEAIGGLTQGELTVWCTDGDLRVNPLAPGETRSVTILPDDGLITKTENGNLIHLYRNDTGGSTQGACEYTITSTITNGGCVRTAIKKIKFIRPQYSADGKIHGYIASCPSCTNTLFLYGDRPGCDGKGVWTVVASPAGAHPQILFPNEVTGDARAVVDVIGDYTFQYTVTNIEPCAPSVFTITCTVFQIGEFSIGPGQTIYLCDTKIPQGAIYKFCADQLNDVIYEWSNIYDTPGLEIRNPGSACSEIIFHQDVDLSTSAVQVRVTGLRYFIDPDCGGPLPYQILHLPSQTNGQLNQHFIDSLTAIGACVRSCRTLGTNFSIVGEPNPKVKKSDIYFLCSSGVETIRLQDYYTIQNNGGYYTSTTVEVLEQPATSHLVGNQIAPGQLIQLNGGCKYSFRVNISFTDYSVTPALKCSKSIILNVYISAPKNVSAGTDQIKCPKDSIRLNGNRPFDCNIAGTWKQVAPFPPNCRDTVIIENPHDPNTRILINNYSCCNYDLFFEWSFNSENTNCRLSDTTKVHINCCIGPPAPTCVQSITVKSLCKDGKIILTACDELGNLLDPSYQVNWTIDNNPPTGSINPYTYNGSGPIQYKVFVSRYYQGALICAYEKSGRASCQCGIKIEETCDANGNVIVTAIDVNTNLPVTPDQYIHRLFWRAYSGPNTPGILKQNINPLVIPNNSCYSLYYEHHYFPAGSLPTPGREDSICRLELPITCVALECIGWCKDFPSFTMAGFGDALNLPFPPGSLPVCNNTNGNGTLGIFLNGAPVTTPPYNILWKNAMTTPYVTDQLSSINTVRITSPLKPGCFWEGKYEPICNCVSRPPEVNCQKPILKHCNDDGTVTYTPGQTQIVWTPISGAVGYDIEVSVHDIEGCCTGMVPSVTTYYSTTPYWNIPLDKTCFTVRVRAKDSNCPTPPDWSRPFTYCASIPCSPVLIVCGCCGGGNRTAEGVGIEQIVVSETVFNQYQETKSGIGFKTIEEALAALNSEKTTGFAVFPNPTARLLTVKPDNTDQNTYQIELFDVLQRRVVQTQLDGTGEKTIDVSRLSEGMYLLTIRDSKGHLQCTKSVVISK